MRIEANCKINIGLDILRRREDGFHDLSTVMYPIRSLADELYVERTNNKEITFTSSGIIIDCPVDKNLCVRAAKLMQQRYGIGGVAISLHKIVPFGAGLGGGSADATAVIKAIDELYALHLSEEELIDVASQLGSDTAFFIRNTPQLCSGRGEIMSPISLDLSDYKIVMLKPNIAVSTAQAYGGVTPAIPSTPLEELITQPIEEWQGKVKNQFEEHIFKIHPTLHQRLNELLQQGAIYASMSGSGSTIYGIFDKTYSPTNEFLSLYKDEILSLG